MLRHEYNNNISLHIVSRVHVALTVSHTPLSKVQISSIKFLMSSAVRRWGRLGAAKGRPKLAAAESELEDSLEQELSHSWRFISKTSVSNFRPRPGRLFW